MRRTAMMQSIRDERKIELLILAGEVHGVLMTPAVRFVILQFGSRVKIGYGDILKTERSKDLEFGSSGASG